MRFDLVKKSLVLIAAAACVTIVGIKNLHAESQGGGGGYLKQIADNTLGILQKVNDLPTHMENLSKQALAWLNEDKSDTTANLVGPMNSLAKLIVTAMSTQLSMQPQLNSDLLGQNVTPATLWYANDLVYSTLLGQPFFNPDPRAKDKPPPNPQYNYIKNAAGINLQHPIPGNAWTGSKVSRDKYQGYYNTVMAVQSFNGYALSNAYAEGNQFNTMQQSLITQASDPQTWFAQVASESIGFVLRQILMFESQTFILMTQSLQVQKQILLASVMTNSVLIANNAVTESLMVSNAQGIQPTS